MSAGRKTVEQVQVHGGIAWRRGLLVGAAMVAAPLISLLAFGSTGRDDPYITFAAADAFREHWSIANINGDPFEQSTSLLLTIVLALLGGVLPVTTFELGWALGFIGLSVVVLLCYYLLRRYLSFPLSLVGSLALALLPPLSYWAASGAEQTWVVASLIAVALAVGRASRSVGLRRDVVVVSALVLVAFMIRPDAGLGALGGVALLSLAAATPSGAHLGPWRRFALLAAGSAALVGVLSAVRWLMTGTPLPQSVMAKTRSEYESWDWGYVIANAALPYFLVVIAIAVVIGLGHRGGLPRMSAEQVLLALMAVLLLLLLMRSGPDWMEAGRLWLPPAALIALLVLSRLASVRPSVSLLLVAVLLAVNAWTIWFWAVNTSRATFGVGLSGSTVGDRWELRDDGRPLDLWKPADSPYNSWNAVHAKDAQFLTLVVPFMRDYLATHPERPVTVASGDAGMMFYFLKQQFGDDIEFVDRWSLLAPTFSPCRNVNRTPVGTGMSFGKWVQWWESGEECTPDLPDVILDNDFPGEIEVALYEPVLQQEGSWWRERAQMSYGNAMWLAVRKE